MDQKELADSLGKQMDTVADTVYWALLLAVVFLWAGLTEQPLIKALGLEIKRSQALYVACAFYLFANLFILIQFLRIGDLVRSIERTNLQTALTKLVTHKWIANPFAFYGTLPSSMLHGSCGFGLLVVVWWIGNTSLYALADTISSLSAILLQGLFLAIGLGSILAIRRVYSIIVERVDPPAAPQSSESFIDRTVPVFVAFRDTVNVRVYLALAGSCIGFTLALFVNGRRLF